jgi:DNA gyrase subunit A
MNEEHDLSAVVQVVKKRTEQLLQFRQARLHIVEGFTRALEVVDDVVKTIRSAPDGPAARAELQSSFGLSTEQADAVLNMSLRRLTGLAVEELKKEQKALNVEIADLSDLLSNPVR